MSDKKIARTHVKDFLVSTVRLWSDHNFSGKGPPLLFETVVFPRDSYRDYYCARYATEEGALWGHRWVVSELRHGVSPQNLEQHE